MGIETGMKRTDTTILDNPFKLPFVLWLSYLLTEVMAPTSEWETKQLLKIANWALAGVAQWISKSALGIAGLRSEWSLV